MKTRLFTMLLVLVLGVFTGSPLVKTVSAQDTWEQPELIACIEIDAQQLSAEAEPNDRFSQANPIAPSGTVSGAIDPLRDHDWYRLTVESAGELRVFVTNVAPDMEIVVQLWNANYDLLVGWQGPPRPGADTDLIFDLPGPGTYYLEVAESRDDVASAQPYSLQTTFTPAADPGEPNNRFADPTSLTPGSPIQATIFPTRDHDWYSFQVPGRSQVRVLITQVPQDMEMVFQVWNANKDLLLSWQGPPRPGADTDITFDLPGAGTYYLEVAESRDDGRSTQPYTLQITVVPAVDAGEDNDIFMNAQPLQLSQEVQGSILPPRDHDWYQLEIPAPGTLNVSITYNPPELDMVCQVWNADKRVVCGWQGAPRLGADAEIACALEEPGIYYLEVADGRDDASSPEAYHLVATVSSP